MIASLLPGLRDLRTPLATGYTWLIALWLCFQERIPSSPQSHGILKSLYDLAESVGRPALLGSVTFVAYLLGALVELDPSRLLRWWYRKAELPRSRWPKLPLLTVQARSDLAALVSVAESPSADSMLLAHATGSNMYGVERQFFYELPQLVTRLHAANNELFDDYARRTAEATLRFNMAPPLTILVSILAFQWHWAWIVALALPFTLFYQSLIRTRRAHDIVVQALVIGKIDSSVLENMWKSGQIRLQRLRSQRGETTSTSIIPKES